MLNVGNWKQKAGLMALGSVFTFIGMLFTIGMLPTVTAQRDKFGDIECTSLTVVNGEGQEAVKINADSGYGEVSMYGKNGEKGIWMSSLVGGIIRVNGSDGDMCAMLSAIGGRGSFIVCGSDGEERGGLDVGEHGGRVWVYGNDGEWRGGLAADERGGRVFVCGSDGKKRGAIGVSPSDYRAINLWDKHGNRIAH